MFWRMTTYRILTVEAGALANWAMQLKRCNHCPFGSLGQFLQLFQRRLFGPFGPRTEFSMGSMWNVPTCSIDSERRVTVGNSCGEGGLGSAGRRATGPTTAQLLVRRGWPIVLDRPARANPSCGHCRPDRRTTMPHCKDSDAPVRKASSADLAWISTDNS